MDKWTLPNLALGQTNALLQKVYNVKVQIPPQCYFTVYSLFLFSFF